MAVGLSCSLGTANAQSPYLVRDINTTADPWPETEPRELAATSQGVYFIGSDDGNGAELRIASGPTTGHLVRDFAPGPGAYGTAQDLTPSADRLFFFFDGLWRTDSTTPGTVLLKGVDANFNSLRELTDVNGTLFFWASDATGDALWKSDGTGQGTESVASVSGGYLTAVGSRVFFVRDDPATGSELWTSDGTAVGTHLVRDLCPGLCSGIAAPDDVASLGNVLFFRGYDGASGEELWRSDGTPAGTVLVKDIVPGPAGAGPQSLARFGNAILFGTSSSGLWRSDGTDAGTALLRSGLYVDGSIHDAGGTAYFTASDVATGKELWKTDGTPAGTVRVSDQCPGPCSFLDDGTVFETVPGGAVVFAAPGGLWRSDGSTTGTFLLRTFDTLASWMFTPLNGNVYFPADDGVNGEELWRTDGTSAGTTMVTNRVDISSFGRALGSVGPRYFFTARRPDLGWYELWSTTGTSASTSFVELTPGPMGSDIYGQGFGSANGSFFFPAYTPGGYGLWKTDGTQGGTLRLQPIPVHSGFAETGGLSLFASGLSSGSTEPWRTDGTPGGTVRVAELVPGIIGSQPHDFVAFRGGVAFATGGFEPAVWLSDGTSEGTRRITTRSCWGLTVVDDRLFLTCYDPATGVELWTSDGTEAGTRLVKDINPGSGQTDITHATAVEGVLYFSDTQNLWRSDGTEAGTQRLADLLQVPVGVFPQALTVSAGVLYFAGYTPETGQELWRTDGTVAGTFMILDIRPGPASGLVTSSIGEYEMAPGGGGIVFAAYTPERGLEAWFSDGTTLGTIPLPEISAGPSSSSPGAFRSVGGTVYMAATDGMTGYEPWAVTLPPGAVGVGDAAVNEGDSGAAIATFDVRLESPSAVPVVVGYTTIAGTAQAGADFTPRSGTLTFAPGVTALPLPVEVTGDLADETDETFTLQLSPIGPVVLADSRGVAIILDDDGPTVTVNDISVAEGDAGTVNADFVVTLTTEDNGPTPAVKTVGFVAASATATAGSDYDAAAGTLTFAAGSPSGSTGTVRIAVRGDTVDEPDESFELRFVATSDVTVPSQPAIGLILDDDGVASAQPIELVAGASLRATLAPPTGRVSDRDWYVLEQQPYSSYEVVVDETSGDAVPLLVRRMGSDGTTVLQTATAVGTGGSVSLRWANDTSEALSGEHVAIESAACGTECGPDDSYRVRAYDTTLRGARFNSSNGQATVVILHNPTAATVAGRLLLWSSEGYLVRVEAFTLAPRATVIVDTGVVFPDGSGSLTVTHDGPYGSLAGKAVALEPATGFSFDTPMTYRPR